MDERGFALPLALAVIAVLAIAVASMTVYVTANQGAADRDRLKVSAGALADGALDTANSVLYQSSNIQSQSGFPFATRQGSPQISTGFGSAYYWAVFDNAHSEWTLYADGAVSNPRNPNAPVIVHTSRRVLVIPGTQTANMESWNGLYAAPSSCMTISGGTTLTDPAYINGSLCISGGSHFTGSSLQVAGNLTVAGGSTVGMNGAPISRLSVFGSTALSGGSAVYATQQNHLVDTVTKPTVDIAGWYLNANVGPKTTCATRSGTVPSFDNDTAQNWSLGATNLTPLNTPYSCTTVDAGGRLVGQLSWSGASPGILTVKGVIFFDGPVVMNSGVTATYSGQATIYASTVTINGGAKLCGITNCTTSWDPSQNLIVFVAGQANTTGWTINGGGTAQVAVYAVGDASVTGGATDTGPITANNITISGGAVLPKSLSTVPNGAPVNTVAQAPTLQQEPNSYERSG